MLPSEGKRTEEGVQSTPVPWLALFFLAWMHLSLAWALNAAQWTRGLHLTTWSTLAGIFIGVLINRTPWPRWIVRIYEIIVGFALTLYLCSTLISPQLTGLQRPIEVLARLLLWFQTVLHGGTSHDDLVFIADLILATWWLALYGTEQLIREKRVWKDIILIGTLITLNAYYAQHALSAYVLLYLLAALLLLIAHHLEEQAARWQVGRVHYAPDIFIDYLRYGLLLTVLTLLFAWILPPPAHVQGAEELLAPAQAPWHSLQETWARLFGSIRTPASPQAAHLFPRSFNFQGAPHLEDTPYFQIHANRGRYWRSAVYDTYRGSGWDNAYGEERFLPAGTPITPPPITGTRLLTQTITVLQPQILSLIAAPQPIRFDLPVQAVLLTQGEQGEELLFAYAQSPLPKQTTYTVLSLVNDPTADQLRNAPVDYPPEIRQQFTQLPASLPDRVRELARSLTVSLDTPYDKVLALERYLRQLPYSEQIPAPPPDQDAVDWFLFEQQEGYCDYFASALAVMARSVGIPARVASGYARGLYDREGHMWVVRESDAHTWPEIWFPGYGWIPFEPTPSEPLPEREEIGEKGGEQRPLPLERETPERLPEDVEVPEGELQPVPSAPARRVPQVTVWMALIFLVLVGFGVYWRRRVRPTTFDVSRLYREVVRWSKRLGLPLSPAWTPQEVARAVARKLPDAEEWLRQLVDVYQRHVYARSPAHEGQELEVLNREWPRVRGAFRRAWLREWWNRITSH